MVEHTAWADIAARHIQSGTLLSEAAREELGYRAHEYLLDSLRLDFEHGLLDAPNVTALEGSSGWIWDVVPHTRIRNWNVNERDARAWVTAFGVPRQNSRLPRDLVDHKELHVSDWLRRQRRNLMTLNEYQIARLGSLPGFEWEPLDDAWTARFEGFRIFVTTHDRQPSARAAQVAERTLGIWAANQRALHKRGSLAHDRWAKLNRDVWWRW